MSITSADILAPTGPVEIIMFPGENVEGAVEGSTILVDRLNNYIAQAVAKNALLAFDDMDGANLAWALHLTFNAAYLGAVARPSTADSKVEIIGSAGYDKDQRDALLAQAEHYLDEYNVLLLALPTTASPVGTPSRSTTNSFEW